MLNYFFFYVYYSFTSSSSSLRNPHAWYTLSAQNGEQPPSSSFLVYPQFTCHFSTLLLFLFFSSLIRLHAIVFPQVSIWCKQGIFGRKVLLGEVRIALGSLNLSVKQISWYNLFNDSQLSE